MLHFEELHFSCAKLRGEKNLTHTHTVARDYKTKYQKDKREIWLLKIVKVEG